MNRHCVVKQMNCQGNGITYQTLILRILSLKRRKLTLCSQACLCSLLTAGDSLYSSKLRCSHKTHSNLHHRGETHGWRWLSKLTTVRWHPDCGKSSNIIFYPSLYCYFGNCFCHVKKNCSLSLSTRTVSHLVIHSIHHFLSKPSLKKFLETRSTVQYWVGDSLWADSVS